MASGRLSVAALSFLVVQSILRTTFCENNPDDTIKILELDPEAADLADSEGNEIKLVYDNAYAQQKRSKQKVDPAWRMSNFGKKRAKVDPAWRMSGLGKRSPATEDQSNADDDHEFLAEMIGRRLRVVLPRVLDANTDIRKRASKSDVSKQEAERNGVRLIKLNARGKVDPTWMRSGFGRK